jgi:phosphatidylglycerophosphate synthase
MSQIRSKIVETFKSDDTEEILDRLFYRPVGYGMAVVSRSIGISPNFVTIVSIFIGVLAGHLFYYQDTTINLIGVFLLITAEAMDSADGQLARMTKIHSRYGKILDGFAGNLMFTSIYINLCIRFIVEGGSPFIFLVAVIAGFSHSLQSAMSEYYRNFYLYFVYGEGRSIIDQLKDMKEKYNDLSWRREFGKKMLMWFYVDYTRKQEFLSKTIRSLYKYVYEKFNGFVPDWLRTEYRNVNKPLLKYGNILTTNTRMIFLFFTIFYANVLYYFLFEIIILNLLLLYFVFEHERTSKKLLQLVHAHSEN